MEQNSKLIVKNTLFLYVRMLLIMFIGFFTTRVVLDKLGVSDYGIYNVVAGFVMTFTVLNSILQSGTKRFITLPLGSGDIPKLKATFSTAFVIHLLIALVVLIVAETFGLWFLNAEMNFEEGRLYAANWVFQFSVVLTFLNILKTPYNAVITAHEKFSIYAYVSIYESVSKLLIVYLLVVLGGDKLIWYAFMLLCVGASCFLFYLIYCHRKFVECRFSLHSDRSLFREMMQFSGWTTVGHVGAVLNNQGVNVSLNIFLGTAVNAARGLAGTVTFTIQQFVDGFITASVPQLIKFYGAGDMENFRKLIFNVSQYATFLIGIVSVPVLLEVDYVLQLWLKEVPQYTPEFIKITIISSFIVYSNIMLNHGVVAIGRVKEQSFYTTPIYLLGLPLAILVLWMGCSAVMVYWVAMIPLFGGFLSCLYLLHRFANFPSRRFFFTIFVKNALLVLVSGILPWLIQSQMQQGLLRFLVVCSVSIISSFLIFYHWGINDETRQMFSRRLRRFALLRPFVKF